jgi:CBS domain-containing protein
VPVIDAAGRLVGTVSDGDLIMRVEIGTEPRHSWWRAFFSDSIASAHAYVRSHGRSARDVMSKAITASPDEPLHTFVRRMERRRLRRAPVVRDGRVIGVIDRGDLVRKLASHSPPTEHVSDEALRAELMTRMQALPWNLQIRVVNTEVQDGVASLYGWATSPVETRALEVVAENTPGIVEVRSCIRPALPHV